MLFDNGIYGARPGQERIPFHKSFSRGVEYRVDKDAMSVEQVWASALTDADVMERTWAMGDAHRLGRQRHGAGDSLHRDAPWPRRHRDGRG